jgi:hypothetical protein
MNNPALNASALPAIPAYKDRRGWLIAFGIVEIVVGMADCARVFRLCGLHKALFSRDRAGK